MPNLKHKNAINELRNLLGDRLSTGTSIRETHGRDEAYTAPSLPDAVAFPSSTAEVANIVKICAEHGVSNGTLRRRYFIRGACCTY